MPTLDEAGVSGYAAYVWMGVMAPRGTPAPVIALLRRELVASLAAPEVRTYMDNASMETVGSTPAEFETFYRQEKDRWAAIIRDTGAKID